CWTRQRPDAVYVTTEGPLGYSAVRTARRLGIPVFSGFHTNFDAYAKFYGVPWLQQAASTYLRHFHNRTAGTLVATGDLRARLSARGFKGVPILARGVDVRLFTPRRRCPALRAEWGASEQGLVVLHVGRIAPEKNLPLAVEAYRAMQRGRPDLRFV